MTITLERLAYTDLNLLRVLRNADADAFFDTTYITREMQEDWWWRYHSADPLVFPLVQSYTIFLNNVTPVGFLSVKLRVRGRIEGSDYNLMLAEVGNLLLAPAYRGQGIMHAAITEVRRLYDPLTFWIAHVKSSNAASLRLFERQEFWAVDQPKGKRK